MDIFKLVGSVFIDTKKAEGSLAKVDDKAKGTAKSFSAGSVAALAWGRTIYDATAKVATAMADLMFNTIETLDAVDKNSQTVGLSAEEYQKWEYAMGQCGVSASTFSSIATKLREKVIDVTEGNGSAIASFARLGVSIYDSEGKLKSQDEILNDVILSLSSMTDETERDKIAMDLFGKSGLDLVPMLNSGEDAIKDLKKAAEDLGLVIADDDITNVVALGDALDTLNKKNAVVKSQIMSKLAPAFEALADKIISVINAYEKLDGFQGNFAQKLGAAFGLSNAEEKAKDDLSTEKKSFWDYLKIAIGMKPAMAKGGILEKGEIGILEGNGAEAVVPLENNEGWTRAVAEQMNSALGGAETITLLTSILDAIRNVDASATIQLVPDDRKLFEIVRDQSYSNARRGGKPISAY